MLQVNGARQRCMLVLAGPVPNPRSPPTLIPRWLIGRTDPTLDQ